jgi:M6 family metalloprotease-like protein
VNYGGRYVTSTGTLRVLMVWIRFADDNEPSTTWPDPNALPDWAAHFVNAAYSAAGDYYPGAVSGYFYENSYGKFHVIGDVYYVTTDYPESHYHEIAHQSGAVAARAAIEVEMFDKLDRPPYKVNFTRYDNWTLNHSTGFNHLPGPDGILDMCWFMTRNLHDENYTVPSYRFGIGWAVLDCNSLYKDGVLIKGFDYYFPASGIGMFAPHLWRPLNSSVATAPSYPLVNIVAHEMSHYLFGYDHFGVGQCFPGFPYTCLRFVSAMTPYAGGWSGHYSGYEKWRLTWLRPTVVDYNTDNIVLRDQATTIDSNLHRLVKIPIPNTSQYLLVENRQWLSSYEARHVMFGYQGILAPGIVVYHIVVEDDYLTHTVVQKLDADGMFRWKLLYDGPGGLSNDVIDKDLADPLTGFSETQILFIPGRGSEQWQATYWPNSLNPYGGGPYIKCTNFHSLSASATDIHGDYLDLYGVGDVITPWSNPGSHYWNTSIVAFAPTTVGIEIKQFDSTSRSYTIAVRVTNPEQLAPSRPQDLRVSLVHLPFGYASPKLNWTRPGEPDVFYGGSILVYRRLKQLSQNWSPWVHHATVTGIDTEYVDTSIMTAGTGTDSVQYKIRSKDSTNKLSVFSDIVSMNLSSHIWKSSKDSDKLPIVFALHPNHPNPFNPSTTIRYDLPEDSHVSLVIYDVLGRKVAEVVNEVQAAGFKSVTWDASAVASGVYLARFTAIDENGSLKLSKTMKLVLAK